MKKTFLFITLLVFVLMLISCAMNEAKLKESGAKLLSQQDLIEFFKVERIGTGKNKQGKSGKIHYFPDGTQKLKYSGGGDEGKYRVENGQFCSKWKEIRGGSEQCYRIYRTGENKIMFVNLDGSVDGGSAMTFKK